MPMFTMQNGKPIAINSSKVTMVMPREDEKQKHYTRIYFASYEDDYVDIREEFAAVVVTLDI